jgi:FkbM family methyltransferase
MLSKIIKKILLRFGISVHRLKTEERFKVRESFISNIIGIDLKVNSKSENLQDLFVLSVIGRYGYFVEFGASDGVFASNTYLLEKLGWTGILSEPLKASFMQLKKNRKCKVTNLCVWSESNKKLPFLECKQKGLSTLSDFEDSDRYKGKRKKNKKYLVETISLFDLLRNFRAPKIIDYLSIDTEGSEYEILKKFPFDQYKFRVITSEHNFNKNRDLIRDLLIHNGYKQVYEDISGGEDWFIL